MTGKEAYEEDCKRSKIEDRTHWEELSNESKECWRLHPIPRVWGDYWDTKGNKTWGIVGAEYFG